jgi:hypothetical protein
LGCRLHIWTNVDGSIDINDLKLYSLTDPVKVEQDGAAS